MLVQITGQRNWLDWDAMDVALRRFWPELIVQGHARGADLMSRDWAEINGIRHIDMPANWDKHGRAAGPIRNKEMLAYTIRMSPCYDRTVVLAFIDERKYGESKGTANMISICEHAGLEVIRIPSTNERPIATVHNLKHEKIVKGDVYIGRATSSPGPHILGHTGVFGNPYILKKGEPRGETIIRYTEYIEKRVKDDADFVDKLYRLKGKRLFCFCHPDPCHGHILAQIVNELPERA